METRRSDDGAIDEETSAPPSREQVVAHPSVVIRLAGAALLVVGSLGLLEVPAILMFSEGIPDSFANYPGAFIGLVVAASLACIVAGRGVFYGREWARVLAIGLYLMLAASMIPLLPLVLMFLALAGVLVFGWRASRKPAS